MDMKFREFVEQRGSFEIAINHLLDITLIELGRLENMYYEINSFVYMPGIKKIYFWNGRWIDLDISHFEKKFRLAAIRALERAAIDDSERVRLQIFQQFESKTSFPIDFFDRDTDLLVFWNGILYLPSMLFLSFEEYLNDTRIPGNRPYPATLAYCDCDYYTLEELEINETPCWDKIYQIYPKAANALERHIRNILKRDTRDEQMLMLVGPRQTGKSTITEGFYKTLQSLFANTPLQRLKDYGTAIIVGKRAIFCNDHPETELDEEALWFVKNLVEKIPIQIRQIYCPSFTYEHQGYDGILTTNKPMRIPNSTSVEAWLRRMEIEVMDAQVKPDPSFKERLSHEIPIVISQILHFTPPVEYNKYYSAHREEILKERYNLYKYWSNPCYLAIEALYDITADPADCYETDDVELEIQNWLKQRGIGVSLNRRSLESQTYNALSDLGVARKQKQKEGVRRYFFIGLRKKNEIGYPIREMGYIEKLQEVFE